jgi:iron complex transport system substrate-binding protein
MRLCIKELVFVLASSCAIVANIAQASDPRIISADAGVTEILLELEAFDSVVAADTSSVLPEGSTLPKVGYYRALPSEGLLAVGANTLIGNDHMGPPHAIEAAKSGGIEVIQLTTATSIEELIANVQIVAELVEKNPEGIVKSIDGAAKEIRETAVTERSAIMILNREPGKLRVAGRGTSADSMIRILGLENLADFDNYRTLSRESVLAIQPDVIFVIGAEAETTQASFIEMYPTLQSTPAGLGGNIIGVGQASLVAGISLHSLTEIQRIQRLLAR